MKNIIWSPWREKFIRSKKSKLCIFCQKIKSKNDKKSLIVYRGEKCFVILNLYPYNNGHLMVVPNSHKKDLSELDKEEFVELFYLVKKMVNVLKKTHKPNGFNIGLNLGKAAGAGIDEHLHIHIVPRWFGDVNFMPVVSETKVISELLRKTFTLISKEVKKSDS
ncbi:MAG: HIT domain-containing protein [Endomicrobiia bacterium]